MPVSLVETSMTSGPLAMPFGSAAPCQPLRASTLLSREVDANVMRASMGARLEPAA